MELIQSYTGEILAIATAVVWALAVILFKKSGESVHPIALNLFKGVVAFVLLIPTIMIFGGGFSADISPKALGALLLSGVLGIGIADTLFFIGLNNLGAGLSAIAGCIYGPIIIALSFLFLGERLAPLQLIGVAAIISAIFFANLEKAKLPAGNWRRGIVAIILANATIALGVVIMKPFLGEMNVLWATEIRIVGGLGALIVYLAIDPKRGAILSSLKTTGSLKFTLSGTLVGTYFAMILWIAGMKFGQVSTTAALNQTSNIFVFLFAALFLKEKITPLRITGIILAVGGAVLVSIGQ